MATGTMSIDIKWENLADDTQIVDSVVDALNSQLESVQLPDYLQNVRATRFSLGHIPPNITIRHIGDPFPEFSSDEPGVSSRRVDQGSNTSEVDTNDVHITEEDERTKGIQFLVELEYKGDMWIELQVDLLLNYPSPGFIKLPVKLKIVDLGIHSLAVIAHLDHQVYISFLCDVNDDEFDDILKNPTASRGKRIDIIRSMHIESEIGDDLDGSVLRNVGKVEKFLVEMMRGLLRDELGWPGWIHLDFRDDDDDDEDQEQEAAPTQDGQHEDLHDDASDTTR